MTTFRLLHIPTGKFCSAYNTRNITATESFNSEEEARFVLSECHTYVELEHYVVLVRSATWGESRLNDYEIEIVESTE